MVVKVARVTGRMRPRRSFDQNTIVPQAHERGALRAVLADVFFPIRSQCPVIANVHDVEGTVSTMFNKFADASSQNHNCYDEATRS